MIAAKVATMKRGNVAAQRRDGRIWPSSVEEAAKLMNVGRSAVKEANVVLNEGTPEEIKAVERGEAAERRPVGLSLNPLR